MFGRVSPSTFIGATTAALLLAADLTTCLAKFTGNIAYESPSLNHPFLKVPRRGPMHKRDVYSGPLRFTHGVASGDPYSDSVIIWTRAVPYEVNQTTHLYEDKMPVCVAYEVWQDYECDERARKIFSSGETETSGDVDYTVKVDAKGLEPFETYYYRFWSCDRSTYSATGRTKTIPEADSWIQRVSFAVYSCANFAEVGVCRSGLHVYGDGLISTSSHVGFLQCLWNSSPKG